MNQSVKERGWNQYAVSSASGSTMSFPSQTLAAAKTFCGQQRVWSKLRRRISWGEEMIDPALKGTLNVLGSCRKAPSVKRVVLMSSKTAVACNGRPWTPDVVVDETWVSDSNVCEDLKVSKERAKILGVDYIPVKPSSKLLRA
ncbi:hypothetical protein LguiB_032371 [Lonicera macranthoides]